jgi:GTP-binding protein
VDLPGYGFAKASQDKRLAWNEFTKEFFLSRIPLVRVLLLVDASIPPQQIDLECATWMANANVPYTVVFTKADKSKKQSLGVDEHVQTFLTSIEADTGSTPDAYVTSAVTGRGAGQLLQHVAVLRQVHMAEQVERRASSPLIVPLPVPEG